MELELTLQAIKSYSNSIVNSNTSLIQNLENEMKDFENVSDNLCSDLNGEAFEQTEDDRKALKELENKLAMLEMEQKSLQKLEKQLIDNKDALEIKLKILQNKKFKKLRNKILAHKLLTNVMFAFQTKRVSGYIKYSDSDLVPFILNSDADAMPKLWNLIGRK